MTDVWSSLGLGGPTPLERMAAYGRRQAEVNRRAIAENRFPVPGEDPELDSMRQDIAGMFDFTSPLQWGSLGLGGVIRAYHGSPHTFDKFDMSKIGTGEGAQAYGHGLYFAENPAIADHYRDSLSYSSGPKIRLGGQEHFPGDVVGDLMKELDKKPLPSDPGYNIGESTAFYRGLMDGVYDFADGKDVRGIQNLAEDVGQDFADGYEAAFRELGARKATQARAGSTYTVDLNVNHEDLLDWDAPLSQQSEKVRKALERAGAKVSGSWESSPSEPNVFYRKGARGTEATVREIDRGYRKDWLAEYDTLDGRGSERFPTREEAQAWIDQSAPIEAGRGAEAYQEMRKHFANDADISSRLRAAGIPGLRYLDGGSRAAGDGSRNIVLFDDALAQILERNGQPVGGK